MSENKLEKVSINNLLDLGKNIYLYPAFFYKLLHEKKFIEDLEKIDKNLFIRLKELDKLSSKDAYLVFAQYLFNPFFPIATHGMLFKEYKDVGERILNYGPKIDVYIEELIEFSLISLHMENVGDDIKFPELYKEVKKIETNFQSDNNFNYFKMGYVLTKRKTILYDGKVYSNPKSFFEDAILKFRLFGWFEKFEQSKYAYAWLSYIGYDRILNKYESIIKLVENKEELIHDFTKTIS